MEHENMNHSLFAAALHGHHHDNHDSLSDLLVSNTIHSGHSAIQSDIHTASVNNMQETSDAARDAIDATNNIGNLNLASSERNGGETRSQVHQSSGVVRDQMAGFANQAARDHSTIRNELCDVRKEMSDGVGTITLEMAKQHGDIQLEMCKQHGDLSRQIDARAAEAARQLAECCCDIKQLVTSENTATRQLIQSNLLDEANRRASDAQNELNLIKIQASVGGPGNS